MKRIYFTTIMAFTGFSACMPQRQTEIQAPRNSVEYRQGVNESRDRSVTSESQSSLLMSLPIAKFEALNIDGDKLFYSLVYEDDQGKELASRAKTKVVIDPTTSKGVIDFKVPDPSSGFITMKLEEEGTANKFEGKSDLLKVDGPVKVELTLKRINAGDAKIGVDVSFEDNKDNKDDKANNDDNDNNNDKNKGSGQDTDGPDVSKIKNTELAAFVKSSGDPSKWGTPTYEQIKPVSARFCDGCHTSEPNHGDSSKQDFYQTHKVKSRMADASMPTKKTDYANEMDELEAVGFDYRLALKKYAESLGNNR